MEITADVKKKGWGWYKPIVFAKFPLKSLAAGEKKDASGNWDQVAAKWECPEWFKDAKFGLWLHWGPQTVPATGGGWYARHMYMEPKDLQREKWGLAAWSYHRATFGHQSVAGYKEVCNAWKAEKFDADATITRFKKWGARYVAIMGNHHDNFDLFASSVHGWNATKVGPKRDMVGDFAAAARRQNLKWAVSVHVFRTRKWLAPAFGSDSEGPKKGIPYDGNLTKKDGKGTWWEGLDPQQLYALNYAPFETELAQRHLELTSNYKPDLLYFDDRHIPGPISKACAKLYADSLENNGSIQAVVTVKGPQKGTVLDYEKGVAEGIRNEYWQTDTTIADDWFLKPNPDGGSKMLHNARSLKELLVDIVSKRGVLLLNIAVRKDGTIPRDQIAEMDVLGAWLEGNGEAIYDSRPWKIHGEGGETSGGHFNERGIASKPWDHHVLRFTCNKANTVLYVHVFGDPAGKDIVVASLAKEKKLFGGKVDKVSVLGSAATVDWALRSDGLHVKMPGKLPFNDCTVLKVERKP
jgi:alpha-L-fucosidase